MSICLRGLLEPLGERHCPREIGETVLTYQTKRYFTGLISTFYFFTGKNERFRTIRGSSTQWITFSVYRRNQRDAWMWLNVFFCSETPMFGLNSKKEKERVWVCVGVYTWRGRGRLNVHPREGLTYMSHPGLYVSGKYVLLPVFDSGHWQGSSRRSLLT